MYRTAAPGSPPPTDPLLVVPGDGLRDIWVGRASADDVLACFGSDARINRLDDGDVFEINYDADEHDAYRPDRPAQAARPCSFTFEFGLLEAIEVGVYQTDLYTVGGLRIGSTRDQVVELMGDRYTSRRFETLETLRYPAAGIELTVADDGRVSGFTIFRGQRAG